MQNTNAVVWVFFAGVVIFGALVFIFTRKQTRKRALEMQAAAQQIGLTFFGDDQTHAISIRTALFGRGGARRFRNIMNGSYAGFEASLFDYSYTISTGKSSSTVTQTVVAFIQKLPVPVFDLHHEGFFDRVGDVFLRNDIDFESNPEFSRRYHLSGDEKDRIRELFASGLLTYLEALPAESKWHIEGCGFTLLLYRSGSKVDAEQIRPFLDETSSIMRSFVASCGRGSGS
jgi:hypothetical protein